MGQAVHRVRSLLPDSGAILEAIPVAFIQLDAEFRYVYLNHHAEKLVDRKRQEILGKPIWAEFPDLLGADFEHQLRSAMSERTTILFDTFSERLGRWYQVNVSPAPDNGICIFFEDITDRKRIEADLMRKIEELTRSNEDLQRFAYAASHDLQQPMRTIRVYTELIAKQTKGTLSKDGEAYLGFVVSGVAQVQKLIEGLLRYSQNDNGEAVTKTLVDVNSVVATALAQLHVSVEEAAATITFDVLPSVWAAEELLLEVFLNLITNALKYRARSRDPKVRISAVGRSGEWVFAVHDNGIGIEKQYAKQVFGPFQRLHSASQYEGSGLGLAICKRIVERHGGRIWVESKPGEESTFFFTLPTQND